MTISSSTSRVDYVGNGSTTAFPVPFAFFDASELRVVSRVIATGTETVQTLTTHYTVSGGGGSTGTVTAVTAPAATVQWSILRNTRRTQDVDFQPNDPLPADTLERGLDRVVAIVQEIERDQLRSIRAAETDSTASLTLPTQAERANRNLGFDTNGNPVPVLPQAGTLTVTPYAQGILSAGNATTARGVLGAGATGELLFASPNASQARGFLGGTATGQAVFIAADAAAARTAIGATATGSAVLTATDAAAGRAAINAQPISTATTGVVGEKRFVNSGSGSAFVLPSGGTWEYDVRGVDATGLHSGYYGVSVAAGGTTISAGIPGVFILGSAKRIL